MITAFKNRRARRHAANNVARLHSGKLTKQDAQRIGAWRQTEVPEQQEFLSTLHLLADMEPLTDSPRIRALVEESLSPDQSRQRLSQWPRVAVAASVILIVAVGVLYTHLLPTQPDGKLLRYVTAVGEQKTVNLADDSTLTLNTASTVLVNLSQKKRQLTLERGEAYFEVAKDPSRPFSVNLGARTVTVLGTEFTVRRTPDEFTVAVIEGVVSLHKPEEPVDQSAPLAQVDNPPAKALSRSQQRLKAGMVANFQHDENSLHTYIADDVDAFQRWRNGLVSFAGEPLVHVVRELNRYSGKKILIEDTNIMDTRIYATVKVDRIYASIASLEATHPVKVTHYIDRVVIVGSPSDKK